MVASKASDDDDHNGGDTPQIRALRLAVIAMSLLLIVGFITVIGRIIYLASRPGASQMQASGALQALKPEASLDLPGGSIIKTMSLSGSRLAVHYVGQAGEGIVVVDLEAGRVVSRIAVGAGAKP